MLNLLETRRFCYWKNGIDPCILSDAVKHCIYRKSVPASSGIGESYICNHPDQRKNGGACPPWDNATGKTKI